MTTSNDFGSRSAVDPELRAGPRPLHEISAAEGQETITERGVVLVIGASDTGKTTWCSNAARAAQAAGLRVAIVDADAGQSEIGTPAALGLGILNAPFTRMSELRPRALAFIGSTSPPGYLLEWVIGVRALVDRARELDAETILVDMPGLVSGTIGLRLHQAVAEAIRPDACILLERENELRTLARGLPPCRIVRQEAAKGARVKTQVVRKLRRTARYAQYFQAARECELTADRGTVRGGALLLGRPIRASAMEALQQNLSTRLVHVEEGVDGVRVISSGAPTPVDRAALSRRFGRRRILWLEESRLESLLLGLLDDRGETVALGSLLGIDFRLRTLRVATPWIDSDSLGGFIWGTARAGVDGIEKEPLKRGDV